MKKQAIFLAFLVLLMILISSTVSATAFNNTTNNRTNFTSTDIQPVIDHINTTDNDTVIIRQGDYSDVILNKSLTLRWDGVGTRPVIRSITITSTGSGSRLIGLYIRGDPANAGILLDAANNVVIEDSIIKGFNATGRGISLINAHNNTIRTSNIRNNSDGILLSMSTNNTIIENILTNNYDAVRIRDSSYNTVTMNNITENARNGVEIHRRFAPPDMNVDNNIVTMNNLIGNRFGVFVMVNNPNRMNRNRIHFNRILNSTSGFAIRSRRTPIPANASYNWYGSNENVTALIQLVDGGNVTFAPWLVLSINATPVNIQTGGSATVTTDLRHDNTGALHNITFLMDGIPVTFSSTLGTVSPVSGNTISSKASATFTAGGAPGTATVNAAVDTQTVSTSITVIPPAPPVYRRMTYTVRVSRVRRVRRRVRVRVGRRWVWRWRWVTVRDYVTETRYRLERV